VEQVEVPAAPDQGQPNPATQLKISGFASNYEAVNDYLLTLQASPFLEGKKTAIESAPWPIYPYRWLISTRILV
jgi:type IV pilus assembly protein PilN